MQFYFIRHGQSVNNLLWIRTGSSEGRSEDPVLTPTGRRQAREVARFLQQADPTTALASHGRAIQNVAGFGITHLYTSMMLRSVSTATTIAEALDLPLVAWKDLHETGGIFRVDKQTGERIGLPGKNRAYFETYYPHLALPDDVDQKGWWNRPFEEYESRPLRAKRTLNDLLDRHGGTDDRVAVVSHAGFYNHLLRAILDLPEQKGFWFAINNAAMTRIDFNDEEVVLNYSNRIDFLPKELLT